MKRLRVDVTVFDDTGSVETVAHSALVTLTGLPDPDNVQRAINRVAEHFARVDGLWRPFPMPEIY